MHFPVVSPLEAFYLDVVRSASVFRIGPFLLVFSRFFLSRTSRTSEHPEHRSQHVTVNADTQTMISTACLLADVVFYAVF